MIARTPNGEPANKSCSRSVDLFVAPDSGVTGANVGDAEAVCTTGTTVIYSGSGSSNVENCLINHNANSRGAIGMLTTEGKAGTANWRFVKVDGVAPTQANAASGRYRHYVESTINTRTTGAFATSLALGYPAFVNRLKADFANPVTIKLINGDNQPFGAAGLMALGVSGGTVDFTGASAVLPWTKLVSGTSLDNCQAPKVVF